MNPAMPATPLAVPASTYICQNWCTEHDDGTMSGRYSRAAAGVAYDQMCRTRVFVESVEIVMTYTITEGTTVYPYGIEEMTPSVMAQVSYAMLGLWARVGLAAAA